jgi:uncharacterized protein YoxC
VEVLAIAAVVLLAILVGVAIPVLLQLRATLKSVRHVVESTGPRLDRALADFSDATARLKILSDGIEANTPRVKHLMESAEGLAHGMDRVGKVLTVAAAVGPAAFAAAKSLVSSFVGSRSRDEEEPALREEGAALPSRESWGPRPAES